MNSSGISLRQRISLCPARRSPNHLVCVVYSCINTRTKSALLHDMGPCSLPKTISENSSTTLGQKNINHWNLCVKLSSHLSQFKRGKKGGGFTHNKCNMLHNSALMSSDSIKRCATKVFEGKGDFFCCYKGTILYYILRH